uniref:Uncharacterized protein n=1 Tax=Romanomermis culicivorax TaxID=13658 RepID=A0A915L967_ROMCU
MHKIIEFLTKIENLWIRSVKFGEFWSVILEICAKRCKFSSKKTNLRGKYARKSRILMKRSENYVEFDKFR